MSRAKHSESLQAVQLFPFVAVLLCTMGSLLVLLVSVARSSKDRATVEAVAAQVEARAAIAARAVESKVKDEAAERELAEIETFKAKMDTVQMQAAGQLRDDQFRLSHLEDHIRRLQEELDALKSKAAELNSLAESRFDNRRQAEQELERLRQLLKERKQSISQMRKEKKGRRSYAVLPFKKGGTFRPPVYFECSGNYITLQPERIQFIGADFRGPPGPGHPIAAAFRATRELMVKQSENPDAANEPYALIIVRPEGTTHFDMVMRVFDKSGIDFGYEIIESDAKIDYPLADPQYYAAQSQAVLTARARLDMLASAAPQVYDLQASQLRYYGFEVDENEVDDELVTVQAEPSPPKEDRPGKLFANNGNANYEGGGGGIGVLTRAVGGDAKSSGTPVYVAALPGSKRSAYGSGEGRAGVGTGGNGDTETAVAGTIPSAASPANSAASGPQYHDSLIAMGTVGNVGSPGVRTAGSSSFSQRGEVGGGGVGGGGVGGGGVGGGGVGGGGVGGGGASGGGASGGGASGGGASGGGASGGGASGGGAETGSGRGGTSPTDTSNPGTANSDPMLGQANAVSIGNTRTAEQSGLPQFGNYNPHAFPANGLPAERPTISGEGATGRSMPGSLSNSAGERQIHEREYDDMPVKTTKRKVRGKDWAIRGRTADAVPIRRKIHVLVQGDSLVIRRDASLPPDDSVASEIPLIGQTALAREELADALEKRIRSWGMAGQGLYWRPVISLEISPDGAGRAKDLAVLLRNSGIELEAAAVAQVPEGANVNASR